SVQLRGDGRRLAAAGAADDQQVRVLLQVEDHLFTERVHTERDSALGDVIEGDTDLLGQGGVLGGEQPNRGRAVLSHVQELHAQVGAELLAVTADLRGVHARRQVEVEYLHLVVGLEPLERREGGDGAGGVGDGGVDERLVDVDPADLQVSPPAQPRTLTATATEH